MKITNILLISMIALSVMLAGCSTYQYPEGKEIPVTVTGEEQDTDDFKSEFEKLQKLLEEEESADKEAAKTADIVKEAADSTDAVIVNTDKEETKEEPKEVIAIPAGATVITKNEGELVNISVTSLDPEGDTITYTFESPLNSKGKWQTKYGDAGTYKTTITASDGELSTSQDVYIVIKKVNRVPVITNFKDMTVYENETIELKPKVTDPQGGSVSLEYSGWMTTSKKKTTFKDAGKYEVTLKATSSKSEESATATITITVLDKNGPPTILSIKG